MARLHCAIVLAFAALGAVTAVDPLSPEMCSSLVTAEPEDPLLEKEHCGICQMIVENSRLWNWGQHYDALCANMPAHAQDWCKHYACKLAECKAFQEGSCKVLRSKEEQDFVVMSPCPPKYVCSYCLGVPRTQVS